MSNPLKKGKTKMDAKLNDLIDAIGADHCRVIEPGYTTSVKAHKKARITAALTGGAYTVAADGKAFKVVEVIDPVLPAEPSGLLGLDARGNIVAHLPMLGG